jgi:hypothetical protein
VKDTERQRGTNNKETGSDRQRQKLKQTKIERITKIGIEGNKKVTEGDTER